jgi:DNA polymerase/3'-5' exonuclease PolX
VSPDEAAAYLAEIAYMLRHKGDSHRARAFTRVAGMLLRDRPDLVALTRAGQLERLEGVGAGIARTLAELVETRRSTYLERLREEVAPQLAAVEAVLEISQLVETGYQGDLHCHTDW